jgi:hypothetical protein
MDSAEGGGEENWREKGGKGRQELRLNLNSK